MTDYRNRTFAEIAVGESATTAHALTVTDIEALALASGDVEPLHIADIDGASTGRTSVQGAASIALLAGLLSRRLPGPGSAIVGTQLRYAGALRVGDTLTATVTARSKDPATRRIEFACHCVNQRGEVLIDGVATVTASDERIAYSNLATPELILRRNDGFASLFQACRGLAPVTCAIVHPCDRDSLRGSIEAATLGLIVPVLVGPEAKIRAVAECRTHRPCAVPDRCHRAQSCRRRQSRGDGAQRRSRIVDERQPPHRRTDGGRRGDADGAAHGQAHQPRVRHGRSRLSKNASGDGCRSEHHARPRMQGGHLPERDCACARAGHRRTESRHPFRDRNGDAENSFDGRCRCAMQDGRPRADHGRLDRRTTRVRQRHQRGSGEDQGHRFAGRRPCRHIAGARPRIRQHPRQAIAVSRRRGVGGHCARRARAGCADVACGFCALAPRVGGATQADGAAAPPANRPSCRVKCRVAVRRA